MVALELRGLSKHFGRNLAVNDLDLVVEEGQIRGLIGPNGSGKTTVFNLICGFLRPTRGKVFWQGRDITNMPTYKIIRLGLARTFQLTALFTEMTALQNVADSRLALRLLQAAVTRPRRSWPVAPRGRVFVLTWPVRRRCLPPQRDNSKPILTFARSAGGSRLRRVCGTRMPTSTAGE